MQSVVREYLQKMHAFSYSIKNIISFRRIVLPERPRTRKTRVEEASPDSTSIYPRPIFLFHPATLLPTVSLSLFPCFLSRLNLVSLSLSSSRSRSEQASLDLFLFCFCPVLCHPQLLLSVSIFLPVSFSFSLARPSLSCATRHTRKGKFSLLEFSPLCPLSSADITRGGNFAIFLGERFIEKLIMQLRILSCLG